MVEDGDICHRSCNNDFGIPHRSELSISSKCRRINVWGVGDVERSPSRTGCISLYGLHNSSDWNCNYDSWNNFEESTFKYKDEEIQPKTHSEKVQPKTDLKKSPTQKGTIIAIIAGIIAVIVIIGYVSESPPQTTQQKTTESIPSAQTQQPNCSGEARCYVGKVTGIINGDTIQVDGQSVRFALASTLEVNKPMGLAAKQYLLQICPIGSKVTVDEDDGQTEGSYERIVALVHCNGMNLNEAIIEKGFGHLSFVNCDKSEFADEAWSGCGIAP